MNRSILAVVLSFSALACQAGVASDPVPCPDAALTDASPPVPADPRVDASFDSASPNDGGFHCKWLEINSIAPAVVTLPRGTDTPWAVIVLHGCGFNAVRDVEVNVMSVPFTVIDDETIAFDLPFWHAEDFEVLPATVQVDVIVRPATQVQTNLTFQ